MSDFDLVWVLETIDGIEHKVSLIEGTGLWTVSYYRDWELLDYEEYGDRIEALISFRKVKRDVRAGKYTDKFEEFGGLK